MHVTMGKVERNNKEGRLDTRYLYTGRCVVERVLGSIPSKNGKVVMRVLVVVQVVVVQVVILYFPIAFEKYVTALFFFPGKVKRI